MQKAMFLCRKYATFDCDMLTSAHLSIKIMQNEISLIAIIQSTGASNRIEGIH